MTKSTTFKPTIAIFPALLWLLALSPPLYADDYVVDSHYCYGNATQWLIEGRIVEDRKDREAKVSDNWLQNIWRKLRQLSNDEEKEESISILAQNRVYSMTTDDEGFFNVTIRNHTPLAAGWYDIQFILNQTTGFLCRLLVPPKENRLAIISDFDDTVIVSKVASTTQAMFSTLTQNYKQRTPVSGMSDFYRLVLNKNPIPEQSILFFVTGSHKQLQKSIEGFLQFHHFPKHTVIAKKISGRQSDPLFDQYRYKLNKIESLFKLYPRRRFILIGDDGQQDPEVYERLRQQYPEQVSDIWIRQVNDNPDRKRYATHKYFSDGTQLVH